MAANKAAAADNKVASVLAPLELVAQLIYTVQAMVGRFVQIITVEGPDLDGFLLFRCVGIAGPSI